MRIKTSKEEIKNLAMAWVAVTIAFTILFSAGMDSMQEAIISLLTFAFIVGVSVILHEMAHKLVAQHYGLFAEFRADKTMLAIAVVTALFGFIIIAPGGVMIAGHAGNNRMGKIGMAGPLTNILLAILFFALTLAMPNTALFNFGFKINSWLAVFNLIPLAFFDGAKVFRWNKRVYFSLAAIALLLLIL